MKSQARSFDRLPAAMVGQLGEVAGSNLMKTDGASMISLCRIDTGGAPMLERGAVRGKLVLPDYQVFNWKAHPGACFVEIKTYEQSAPNYIESRRLGYPIRTHGIPVRLFNHYCNIERDTGLPVFLAVNELDQGEMRIGAISELPRIPCTCRGGCRSVEVEKHIHRGGGIREAQWYFDREDFSIVYKHSDRTIAHLRREHSRLLKCHAIRSHVHREQTPRGVLSEDHCSNCGTRIVGTIFRVGPFASYGCPPMCGGCWRAGNDPQPGFVE